MKAIYRVVISSMVLIMMLGSVSLVNGMDDPGFSINRMVISRNIEDREPVSSGDFFSAASEKLFCFLEASDIKQDTMISFVWYYESREMAHVELPLQKGWRWRTWSSKEINGLKGKWKVELHDTAGNILNTAAFTVE